MNTVIDVGNVFCPVCYQIPGNKIFQCLKGHILCELCIKKMEFCPQCWESIQEEKRARNIFMEQALDGMEFDCPFLDNGCKTTKMRRNTLSTHRSSCKFGKSVQICAKIASDECNFTATCNNMKHVVTHLEDTHGKKHDIKSHIGRFDQYQLENMLELDSLNGMIAVCSQMINLENESDGSILNILFIAKVDNGILSWFLFCLSEDMNDTGLQGEISSCEDSHLSWVVPVVHLLDADKQFKDPSVKIPVASFKQNREMAIYNAVGDPNSYNYNIRIRIVKSC